MRIVVRRDCTFLPCLFTLIAEMIIRIVQTPIAQNGIDIRYDRELSELGYVYHITLLSGYPSKLQLFLHCMNDGATILWLSFAPSKCKIRLQDWIGSNPSLAPARGELGEVSGLAYSYSCTSAGGRISDEVSLGVRKVRLAFSNLRHPFCRPDIQLSTRIRAYATVVKSVMPQGLEGMFVESRGYTKTLGRIWWEDFGSNIGTRYWTKGFSL